jgi:glycosyltransferase involved in cell wall biosynthesis
MGKILIIDYCNYIDYQIGGHLSFAKNLIIAFGDKLTLVGITTEKKDPVGKWFKKTIGDVTFDYFALKRYDKAKTKHILPDRLFCFLLLRYYKKRILNIKIQNVFIQRQEILPAIRNYRIDNICYLFPGLENPLTISKYWFGKYIAKVFDNLFFASFKNVNLVLAAGDEKAIDAMILRSKGQIKSGSVVQFPTRLSTDIFYPQNRSEVISELNIPAANSIIVTTGRLTWLKGWKFMIDCFSVYEKIKPGSLFYLIGEGEDNQKIEEYIAGNELSGKVILVGKQDPYVVAKYLNAADLFIMGSHKEGWSTSLIEAIACGIPACVTNFSSASTIIVEGINGYVIRDRNIDIFVNGMVNTLKMSRPIYNDNVKVFSTDKLKEDLLKIWKLI